MSSEPLVSVIIPTYNRAKLLPTAIQSVLGQTHKNVEVLVIDDGSTDETTEVIGPFEDKIVYLTSEHKGTAHARNIGMKAASGKYIAFCDSDDTYLPNKLKIQVTFIENHPEVGMVCTEFSGAYENGYFDEYHMRNYHTVWDRKGWIYEDVFDKKGNFSTSSLDRPIPYYIGNIFGYVLMGSLIPSNTILFPKFILETVGFQNEAYITGQEYEFAVRICKHFQIAFLDIPTYVLLHHKGQSTSFLKIAHSGRRKSILKMLEQTRNPFLGAVIDWAFNDKDYYHKNQIGINFRLAEIYLETGICWMQDGDDTEKAREHFKKSHEYDPTGIKYHLYKLLSFTPLIIRRFILRLLYKITKWLTLLRIIRLGRLPEALKRIWPGI